MSKLNSLIKIIKYEKKELPWAIYRNLAIMGVTNFIPDTIHLKICYRLACGKKLDLKNPKTFNEKIQWLKLNNHKDEYTIMVDKYEAKKYVANKIGYEHIIPTLGVWNRFDDIDFNELPEQFVLKCTHDSGGLVICKDKKNLDIAKARKKINTSLKRNFYYFGREWPYKNVKPRIIAEKYMENRMNANQENNGLVDYKIWCANSIPIMILVCSNRFSESGLSEDFYDIDWNHLDIKRPRHDNPNIIYSRPQRLDEMLHFSKVLAQDIPFVRVDFYEINGNIYFGELTFSPASGFERFVPDSMDMKLGKNIKLETKNE